MKGARLIETKLPPGKYTDLDDKALLKMVKDFDLTYTEYCDRVYGSGYLVDAYYDTDEIDAIFRRVDKRRHYYNVFHGISPSETKLNALFCFWLLKYRPLAPVFRDRNTDEFSFFAQEQDEDDPKAMYDDARTYFTERFCIYILEGLFSRIHDSEDYYLDIEEHLGDFAYNLRNADISKEAMIMLFEALTL